MRQILSTNNSDKKAKKTFIYLLIWIVAVLLFFAPSTLGGKVIAPLDCQERLFRPFSEQPVEGMHNQFVVDGVSQYLPYKWAIYQSFREDGYMGWVPNVHNGNAGPENTMTSPGDPLNFLYAFLPFWTAWDLGVILQFLIAGIGMLILISHCKIPLWGALLAAISFAFYSQFILWMYHKWVGALIWGPYLVWALLRFKQYTINVPAILFMALAWRTGHLQACTFAFILVACVWIAEIWKKDGQWPNRKELIRITISYFLTGVVGALLSLDVFVDTLARMEGCKNMPLSWGVQNIFSIITTVFPTVLGIPETHDAAKIYSSGLFDIKYGGSIVFILASIGVFNKKAPFTAKILFIGSFILACTPLVTYIYSRSTVVMGLGMAWLAAWQLYNFTQTQYPHIYLKRITAAVISIAGLWFICSLVLYFFHDSFAEHMKAYVNAATIQSSGRIAWQELRVERFLDQCSIWHWKNLLFIGGTILGIIFCSRIKAGASHNAPWIAGVILITYAQIMAFGYTWITYSDKPNGPYIYNEPSWMPEFKKHVKDGSLIQVNPSNDCDFLCNNQFSIYGIRLGWGYETFQPKYLKPLTKDFQNTMDYAQAGISHIISDTKWKDHPISGWNLVMTGKNFKLYENPDYKGRYFINQTIPVKANWRTCNRIHISVPPHANSLTVLESYHPGWKAYVGDATLEISPTERGGIHISLPQAGHTQDILLEFHMPYRIWYYPIMLLTTCGLVFISIRQWRGTKF